MDTLMTAMPQLSAGDLAKIVLAIIRILVPVLTGFLLYLCGKPLLTLRRKHEIWANLTLTNGEQLPVGNWENMIGSGKNSDIILDSPGVCKDHAVLARDDKGRWRVTNVSAEDNLLINGECVKTSPLQHGDTISVGELDMRFEPVSQDEEIRMLQSQPQASTRKRSVLTLVLLSGIQVLLCMAFLLNGEFAYRLSTIGAFAGLILCQWLLLGFYFYIKSSSFEVETIAFLLCSMGLAVICTGEPTEAAKQLIALAAGVILFLCIGWVLRDLERIKKVRLIAIVAGIGFLIITLLFGTQYYGAKNWIMLGWLSVQPSELSKVCFVFVGACGIDHIVRKRDLLSFIVYSALICLCLAAMNDFGAALIFFCAFLVVVYVRSGNIGLLALAVGALIVAGAAVVYFAPHALRRFLSWRHIWDDPLDTGYQQTRGLMSIAAGGLFGIGAGQGTAKHIFASTSDMVFAIISEEWGLIMAVTMTFTVVILASFAIRSAYEGRTGLHTIAGCTAASILLMQTILNVLGSLDVLPLTGVTFPFLSNGGSSIISAWGLLAFIKANDIRQSSGHTSCLQNLVEVRE